MTSSSSTSTAIANAVSGKTARPCDCCIKRRARWYCASDDALLCQECDASVHSANPLARRHDRVRLKTSSSSSNRVDPASTLPSWHRGPTRKARSPRQAKHFFSPGPNPASSSSVVVPELDTTSSSQDGENEEDGLLCRVPILDPFAAQLEGSYQPSDLDDLEEFAADVETLLGKGLEDECYGIEELGFFECSNNGDGEVKMQGFGEVVKEEEDEQGEMIKTESDDMEMREPFDFSFVYDDEEFPTTCELDDHDDGQKVSGNRMGMEEEEDDEVCKLEKEEEEEGKKEEKRISLRLDYEAISEAWACQGSPWMNGQRPDVNLDPSWPHYLLGTVGGEMGQQLYGRMIMGGQGGMGDGGREARVSRYREKRRTRLFSKKIRYEVRKLNAEKRPRMKGRFVKRSSFPPPSSSFPLLSK